GGDCRRCNRMGCVGARRGLGIGNELAADIDQFTLFCCMRDEKRFEYGNALNLLFPNDCSQIIVRCYEITTDSCLIKRLRPEPEELPVFKEESFCGLMF